MIKTITSLGLMLCLFLSLCFTKHTFASSGQSLASEQMAKQRIFWINHASTLFNHVKHELPKLAPEIVRLQATVNQEKNNNTQAQQYHSAAKTYLAQLQDNARIFIIITMIANGDIAGLKNVPAEVLRSLHFSKIRISAEHYTTFTNIDSLGSVVVSCPNAFGFVLLKAFLDTTPQEKETTRLMLEILTQKKLNTDVHLRVDFVPKESLRQQGTHITHEDFTHLKDLAALAGIEIGNI